MFHLYMQEMIPNIPEFIFKFWQTLVLSPLYHTLNIIQTSPILWSLCKREIKLFLDVEIKADTIIMKNHLLHWAKLEKALRQASEKIR